MAVGVTCLLRGELSAFTALSGELWSAVAMARRKWPQNFGMSIDRATLTFFGWEECLALGQNHLP